VYGVLAEGITFRLQGTVTPHAFMGQHKIISDGKIIAVAAGQDKTHGTLNPPDLGSTSMTSPDVQLPKTRIRHLAAYLGGQTQMVIKMVVRRIAELSE
jgi:hypothetical protein